MTERLDAIVARSYTTRDGEVKTAFTRIGTAWKTTKGWSVNLDALPTPTINDKGVLETRILLWEPQEKPSGGRSSAPAPASGDDIPF